MSSFLAIRCSEPEEITNGDVDRKCQTFGCRISYQCRAGYELVGRQHRYCQADGSWSPRILPECVRKLKYYDCMNEVVFIMNIS